MKKGILLVLIVAAGLFSAFASNGDGPGADANLKSHGSLYANLWMQNSAEYEAICIQTYNMALFRTKQTVEDKGLIIEGKQAAVALDLDETVLDNRRYLGRVALTGEEYDWETWSHWEREHGREVKLVPGARDFLQAMDKLGVETVFISNRYHKNRGHTARTLARLDIIPGTEAVSGENSLRLLLAKDTSDKSGRRQKVESKYHVIAWLGDNLGDMPMNARTETRKARHENLRKHKQELGRTWFVFPNPVYGHWSKYLDLKKPQEHLETPDACGPDCPLR